MNKLILNRQGQLPADSWYQIEVTGEHYNPAAGVVQVIDAKAVESIVNRFGVAAQSANFAGLLIDQDHFSLDPEKSTEAFGWLRELRNRDGQLEGRVEWTDLGKPAVESGRFKFFSTVYAPADVEKLGELPIKNGALRPAIRPLALDRLAVTNDPNNKGGKPISNRDPGTLPGAGENQPTDTMKNQKLIQLLAALGVTLALDAAPEAVDAALDQGIAKVGETTAIKNRLTTLETDHKALLEEQADATLEKYSGVIVNRDDVRAGLIANRKGTLAILAGIKAPAAEPLKPITNRAGAKTPAELEADKTAAVDSQQAARIRNRAGEIQRTERISFKRAFEKAQREAAA